MYIMFITGLTTYNKTKWKGHEMIVQQAKESFLTK